MTDPGGDRAEAETLAKKAARLERKVADLEAQTRIDQLEARKAALEQGRELPEMRSAGSILTREDVAAMVADAVAKATKRPHVEETEAESEAENTDTDKAEDPRDLRDHAGMQQVCRR
ncbi:MAG: hypothetical protein BJ554DRAFT_606 [Olpidium bornovanus]|uniref:Uncharacterized protein n=1 Tax=Olpidium bornovanus TaxID=278681 RepID=A0A8H7ZTJ9_9FUNG|nr:MAG: hypothetical protein BJ554DRAFT_606 [Olpidium bornovanus]